MIEHMHPAAQAFGALSPQVLSALLEEDQRDVLQPALEALLAA